MRPALAALLVGATCIALSPIFVRVSEAGPTATAFWRVALAVPALWLLCPILKKTPVSAATAGWPLFLAAGAAFAGDLAFWHSSIKLTSVANSTLLANLADRPGRRCAGRRDGDVLCRLHPRGEALARSRREHAAPDGGDEHDNRAFPLPHRARLGRADASGDCVRLVDAARAGAGLACRRTGSDRVCARAPAGAVFLGQPALPAGNGGGLRLGAAVRAAGAAADRGRMRGFGRDLSCGPRLQSGRMIRGQSREETTHGGQEKGQAEAQEDTSQRVESLQIGHAPVAEAGPQDDFGLKVTEHVRENDVVYKVK